MANVSSLVNAYEGRDFARPNLFLIRIPFLGEDFQFRAKAGSLPPSTNGTIEVSWLNRKVKIPGDRTYEQWTITVYNDDQQNIRERLLAWSEQVNSHGDVMTSGSPNSIKHQAEIDRLNRAQEVVRTYTVTGVWPQNVGEVELDWENNDQVETFQVTLEVDWHEPAEA